MAASSNFRGRRGTERHGSEQHGYRQLDSYVSNVYDYDRPSISEGLHMSKDRRPALRRAVFAGKSCLEQCFVSCLEGCGFVSLNSSAEEPSAADTFPPHLASTYNFQPSQNVQPIAQRLYASPHPVLRGTRVGQRPRGRRRARPPPVFRLGYAVAGAGSDNALASDHLNQHGEMPSALYARSQLTAATISPPVVAPFHPQNQVQPAPPGDADADGGHMPAPSPPGDDSYSSSPTVATPNPRRRSAIAAARKRYIQMPGSKGGPAAGAGAARPSVYGTASSHTVDLIKMPGAAGGTVRLIREDEVELGPVIGIGAFGYVRAGRWRQQAVAVKVMLGTPRAAAEELRAEVRAMTGITHDNVIELLGVLVPKAWHGGAATESDPLAAAYGIVTPFMAGGSVWDAIHVMDEDEDEDDDGGEGAHYKERQKPRSIEAALPSVVPLAGVDPEIAAVLRSSANMPRLPVPIALGAALGLAEGMAFLHARKPPMLHRDLKSPNLLLRDADAVRLTGIDERSEAAGARLDGASAQMQFERARAAIAIADLGLAKAKQRAATLTGGLGTIQWLCPLMLAGGRFKASDGGDSGDYSARRDESVSRGASGGGEQAPPRPNGGFIDVFAFGVVMFELATSLCPYDGWEVMDMDDGGSGALASEGRAQAGAAGTGSQFRLAHLVVEAGARPDTHTCPLSVRRAMRPYKDIVGDLVGQHLRKQSAAVGDLRAAGGGEHAGGDPHPLGTLTPAQVRRASYMVIGSMMNRFPPAFCQLMRRAWARAPELRPSMHEAADELRCIARNLGLLAVPPRGVTIVNAADESPQAGEEPIQIQGGQLGRGRAAAPASLQIGKGGSRIIRPVGLS